MSSHDFHDPEHLMKIADAVGVVTGPTSAQPEGKLLIHPCMRTDQLVDGHLDEVLEDWSFAATGCFPLDEPIDLVPADPADADRQPPEDVDACVECAGQGDREVLLDGEYFHRICSWCNGTGERTHP